MRSYLRPADVAGSVALLALVITFGAVVVYGFGHRAGPVKAAPANSQPAGSLAAPSPAVGLEPTAVPQPASNGTTALSPHPRVATTASHGPRGTGSPQPAATPSSAPTDSGPPTRHCGCGRPPRAGSGRQPPPGGAACVRLSATPLGTAA